MSQKMYQLLLPKRRLNKTKLQMLLKTRTNLKMPLLFKQSKRMSQRKLQLLLLQLLKSHSNLQPNTKENKISNKLSLDILNQLKKRRKKNLQLAIMDLNMLQKSIRRISKKLSQDTCQRAKSHHPKKLWKK